MFNYIVDQEVLAFEARGDKLFVEGYDLEDEKLAARLTGIYSQSLLFLWGEQVLLREGEEAFNQSWAKYSLNTKPRAKAKMLTEHEHFRNYFLPDNRASWHIAGIRSAKLLNVLSSTPQIDVLYEVAKSPYLDKDTIRKIVTTLSKLPGLNSDGSIPIHCDVLRHFAQSAYTPLDLLDLLSDDASYREDVLRNPNTPMEIQLRHARGPDPRSRRFLAEHSQHIEVLRVLAYDKEVTVRERLTRNKDLPWECIRILAHDEHSLVKLKARACTDLWGRIALLFLTAPRKPLKLGH